MMEKAIALCGLDCAGCPAFHAAERLSLAERAKVAEQWAKEFHAELTPQDIDCVGCALTTGAHVGYCSMCEIRRCAMEKKVSTCAACAHFGCARLEAFLANAPQARANLVALRGG
jgi:hypothetical protein